jgi:small-conductance mechanosensitive channel
MEIIQLFLFHFEKEGRKIVIPTIKIASDMVINYQRSKNYAVKLRLIVSFDTPSGDLLKLKDAIHDWLKKDPEVLLIIISFSLFSSSFKKMIFFTREVFFVGRHGMHKNFRSI